MSTHTSEFAIIKPDYISSTTPAKTQHLFHTHILNIFFTTKKTIRLQRKGMVFEF